MKDDVLFQIKEENLETGLRGFPVGYCTTSSVDPEKGLFYAGQPVSELAFKDPLEVIYLLYTGKNGNKGEVSSLGQDLAKRAIVSDKVLESIIALPKNGHPMK